MLEFMKRVAVWNSKRYDQVFDKALFVALLREEHKEWRDATEEVNKLDALCDEVFVAFGAAWKANLSIEELDSAMVRASQMLHNLIECLELYPAYFNSTYIDVFEDSVDYPLAQTIANIVTACMTEMRGMGLSKEQCEKCLAIVATSNESKSITKLKPGEKGFTEGKGPYFIPPEPALQKVLNERFN